MIDSQQDDGADDRANESSGLADLVPAQDGKGFDPSGERAGHFGLDNMQSRAAEIGAVLSMTSAPGQGTEVRLALALADSKAALRNTP
jgi:nitrate/nitrite-specific signal transduction histidine kinase